MRFFAVVGFTYLITLITANFVSNSYLLTMLFVLLFLFFVVMKRFKKQKIFIIISLTGLVAACVYIVNYNLNVKPVKNISEMDLTVTGKIVELPVKKEYGKYHYVLKVSNIISKNLQNNFKVMLYTTSPIEAEIYDSVTCDIHTFLPENTPEFPAESFYSAKGIYIQAFLYDHKPIKVEPSTGIKPFYYYALKMRQKSILIINSCFSKAQSSIINGIFLGNREMLSESTKIDFMGSGIYHLLAVSGVHISILTNIFVKLLQIMRINRKNTSILVSIMIFLFMSLTGFCPSVLRSGIMTIIYLLGNTIFRKADSINSLGFAMFLVTVLNPYASIDIGLWLSFTATLGILVLTPRLKLFLQNYVFTKKQYDIIIFNYIIDSILVTISATVFTFPIIAIYYKSISIFAILSNFLIIFPVSMILFLITILIFFSILRLPIFAIAPIKLICGLFVNYIIYVTHKISLFPFSYVSIDYFYIKVWTIFIVISVLVIYFLGKLKTICKQLVVFSIASFAMLFVVNYIKMINLTRIAVINAGNGCSLVCSKDNTNIVMLNIDNNTYTQKIINYLDSINTSKVDCLILSKYSDENLEFINKFIDTYNINDVSILSDEEYELNGKGELKLYNNNFNSKILGNSDLLINTVNETRSCLINVLNVKILICPDGGEADNIPSEWRECDVFVIGGVPSNYNKISCLYTVLSMSKKDSDIVIPKIKSEKTNLLSTSTQGVIYIDINKYGNLAIGRKI